MTELSISLIAELYGCSRRTISTLAWQRRKERGYFGRKLHNTYVFNEQEVEELRPKRIGSGRPKGSKNKPLRKVY
jgi:hypothetical protein